MASHRLTGILGKERLTFRDNAELERYYEDKYAGGGYDGGCILFGTNISELYHRERHRSALWLLKPATGERILDVGCGTGALAARIAEGCGSVDAIDVAGNAFSEANRSVQNLSFRKMNAEALDFPDATFDAIVSVETLEHVIDADRVLAECRRVLKPGGRLVLTYPTVNRTTMQRVLRLLRLARRLEISEHLTEWSCAELIEHAKAAGFEPTRSEGIAFDLGPFGWLKYTCRFLAVNLTRLSLAIRRFPGNSAFVSVRFSRAD
jgi:ubiquinone/menaquinone biosynthesis C-methylase UbiE